MMASHWQRQRVVAVVHRRGPRPAPRVIKGAGGVGRGGFLWSTVAARWVERPCPRLMPATGLAADTPHTDAIAHLVHIRKQVHFTQQPFSMKRVGGLTE